MKVFRDEAKIYVVSNICLCSAVRTSGLLAILDIGRKRANMIRLIMFPCVRLAALNPLGCVKGKASHASEFVHNFWRS